MAFFHGKNGAVEWGTDTVTQVTDFEISQEVDTTDTTVMGSNFQTHLVNIPSWNGSVTMAWDDGDSAQTAMTIGQQATIYLMPEGAGTGKYQLSGSATITSLSLPVSVGDKVTLTASFQGTGDLTIGTDA
jgi:hypothetical protein